MPRRPNGREAASRHVGRTATTTKSNEEKKRPRGRPALQGPEPIPDTQGTIIKAVVRTRSKSERDRILKKPGS